MAVNSVASRLPQTSFGFLGLSRTSPKTEIKWIFVDAVSFD